MTERRSVVAIRHVAFEDLASVFGEWLSALFPEEMTRGATIGRAASA